MADGIGPETLAPVMNPPIPDEELQAISEALFAARRIEAIKIYRKCTGVSLHEAKLAVEGIESDLRAASPEKFTRGPGKGCLGVTVSMLAVGLVAWWWFTPGA